MRYFVIEYIEYWIYIEWDILSLNIDIIEWDILSLNIEWDILSLNIEWDILSLNIEWEWDILKLKLTRSRSTYIILYIFWHSNPNRNIRDSFTLFGTGCIGINTS